MPNYDKLNIPTGLTYCKNPNKARLVLQQILDKAKAGNIVQSQNEFEYLTLNVDGLSRCADFWVFVVRFYVISRDIPTAVLHMQQAFQSQAQPTNVLLQTQQSLQELQKKLEDQQKPSPHIMQQLNQINKTFFENSPTLLSKRAQSSKMSQQDMLIYRQELTRIKQQVFATNENTNQIPSQLGQLTK